MNEFDLGYLECEEDLLDPILADVQEAIGLMNEGNYHAAMAVLCYALVRSNWRKK